MKGDTSKMFGRGTDRGRGHGRVVKREFGGEARGERGEQTGDYHGYAQVFGEGPLSPRTKVKGKKKKIMIVFMCN